MARRVFRPRLIPTLVVVFLLPFLIGLGFWQLERADEKWALEQAFSERGSLEVLRPTGAVNNVAALRYRRAILNGSYLESRQILLDNQVHSQQAGYHVFTPLQLAEGKTCFLVNRGWVPVGRSRSQLPELTVVSLPVEVAGVLDAPPQVGIKLSDDARSVEGWPAVVQWIDTASLTRELGCDVQPLVLRLAPEMADGYVRDWQRVVLTPEKHVSYAVQWFALALALVVIYIVVNLKVKRQDIATSK